LLKETNYIELIDITKAHSDATELLKMLRSAILTTKQKSQ
jgi:hypothetical protein